MKNCLSLFSLLLFSLTSSAQSSPSFIPHTSYLTRAVVVGISDYQDAGIPDLRFAHRDAEAFAAFLRSPAGGKLQADQIKVLINDQATNAQFASALDWLIETSQEGDQAVIYFSGHGDVETKTRSQLGFLLTWDSPSTSYIAGAFPVFFLQEVISTLSSQNKAKVLLVTDACRAGKLAGSAAGGAEATSANLARQFANEVKILSCQPSERSVEGEQWGGGRGVFSYHLEGGLYGLADANGDETVSLLEIGRYLEDHVTPSVAPQSQAPMTLGNRTEKLAIVFPDLLPALRKNRDEALKAFAPVSSRGGEDEALAKADTSVQELYAAFEKALKDKVFFEPKNKCAEAYFARLSKEPTIESLHAAMRRDYAAALQDDAQQVLNRWLKMDVRGMTRSRHAHKFRLYPRYLERAAELLGKEHLYSPTLLARRAFFEGYLLFLENPDNPDVALGKQALQKFRQSLAIQPEAAHTWLMGSFVWATQMAQPDSAYLYAMKAAAAAPSWVFPYTETAFLLTEKFRRYDQAKILLEKAMALDPTSTFVWSAYAAWHAAQGHIIEAEKMYRRAIGYDPKNSAALTNLANLLTNTGQFAEAEKLYRQAIALDTTNTFALTNLGNLCFQQERDAEAAKLFQKALNLDPLFTDACNGLGLVYFYAGKDALAEKFLMETVRLDPNHDGAFCNLGLIASRTGKRDQAEKMYRKSIALNPANVDALYNLGSLCLRTNRPDEAEKCFKEAIARGADFPEPFYQLACLYSLGGKNDAALDALEAAIKKGGKDFDKISKDPDLAHVRSLPAFEGLMKKYFPEKH